MPKAQVILTSPFPYFLITHFMKSSISIYSMFLCMIFFMYNAITLLQEVVLSPLRFFHDVNTPHSICYRTKLHLESGEKALLENAWLSPGVKGTRESLSSHSRQSVRHRFGKRTSLRKLRWRAFEKGSWHTHTHAYTHMLTYTMNTNMYIQSYTYHTHLHTLV